MNKREKKIVFRACPCPSYDIVRMEKWLEEQAEKGLLLSKDGMFADIASFEQTEPRKVKYRLEASRKGTGMWSENGGEPDPEEIELSQAFSWEYIAKRKDFFIYRTFDPSAREMDTDPEVQAMALSAVKKRRREALFSSVFFLVVYPLLLIRGCLLLTAISMGTWWMLLILLFAVLMVIGELKAFLHLRKLQKELTEGSTASEDNGGRRKVLPYYPGKVLRMILALVLIGSFLRSWGSSVEKTNRIPLDQYQETLPFAVMKDLAGAGCSDYTEMMEGMSGDFNTIEEKRNWVAPLVIDYNEHASIKRADGQYLNGGLYVEYYEMRNETFGKILESELLRLDQMKKGFELIKAPAFLEGKATVYRNELHFPTIVFRKGRIVVRAYFYQVTDLDTLPVEEWGITVFESVREH